MSNDKKQKKEEENKALEDAKKYAPGEIKPVKTEDDYPYVIELYDVWGTTSKRLPHFGAKRYYEGSNTYLVNEKIGFKEPFPEDNEEFKNTTLVNVTDKITKLELKLADKIEKKQADDEKDIREELRILKGYKRSLELAGRGGYMIIDQNGAGGKPLFMFDRVKNFKLPVFKNIDISLMYIPSEANITEAGDLLKENEEKNGPGDGGMKLLSLVLVIVLICAICAFGYFTWKQSEGNSELIEVLTGVSDNLVLTSGNFNSATNTLDNLTDNIDISEPVVKNIPVDNLKK